MAHFDDALADIPAPLNFGIVIRIDCRNRGAEILVDDVQDLADKRFEVQCRHDLAESVEGAVPGDVYVDFLFVKRPGSILLELAEKIQDGLDFPVTVLQEILDGFPGLFAVDEVFSGIHVDDDDVFCRGHKGFFFTAAGKKKQKGE